MCVKHPWYGNESSSGVKSILEAASSTTSSVLLLLLSGRWCCNMWPGFGCGASSDGFCRHSCIWLWVNVYLTVSKKKGLWLFYSSNLFKQRGRSAPFHGHPVFFCNSDYVLWNGFALHMTTQDLRADLLLNSVMVPFCVHSGENQQCHNSISWHASLIWQHIHIHTKTLLILTNYKWALPQSRPILDFVSDSSFILAIA